MPKTIHAKIVIEFLFKLSVDCLLSLLALIICWVVNFSYAYFVMDVVFSL